MNEKNDRLAEKTIRSLMEAMSKNSAEKICALFHTNAKQAYGDGAWKSGDSFFSWLQGDIIDLKGHVDGTEFSINGNQVVVTGQYSSKGYTNKANFRFVVEGDKISSWQMRH